MDQHPQPPEQRHPSAPGPAGGSGWVAGHSWGAPRPGAEPAPDTVTRLLQVMVLGAILEVALGGVALTALDDLVAAAAGPVADLAPEAGEDVGAMTSLVRTSMAVGVVVATALSAALWLLFARLFSRGRGRTLGTVLGAVNLLTSLTSLTLSAGLGSVLAVAYVAVVAAGLVLLRRPATTAWFRRVAAARAAAALP